jgi:hypothetical protein
MAKTEPFEKHSDKRNTSVFYKEAAFFSAQEVGRSIMAVGFEDLTYRQTLIAGETRELIQNGFGKGAFVVVKGIKNGETGSRD